MRYLLDTNIFIEAKNLPCISPYEMLRRERARFVPGRPEGA